MSEYICIAKILAVKIIDTNELPGVQYTKFN